MTHRRLHIPLLPGMIALSDSQRNTHLRYHADLSLYRYRFTDDSAQTE